MRLIILVLSFIGFIFSLPTLSLTESSGFCGDVTFDEVNNLEIQASSMQGKYGITCYECEAMVSSFHDFCKVVSGDSKSHRNDFHQKCIDKSRAVVLDVNTLDDRCTEFYDFLKTLYCPVDPCSQITIEQSQLQSSICHLLKCQAIRPSSRANIILADRPTLTCGEYATSQISKCEEYSKKPEENKLGLYNETACNQYVPHFEKEGCDMVRRKLLVEFAPMDPCVSLLLPGVTKEKVCEEIGMKVSETVDLNANLVKVNRTRCTEPKEPVKLNIISATYGVNCSSNVTDNILKSLRNDCEGKIECTFGNRNMLNMSSSWDPTFNDTKKTCKKGFNIVYTCRKGGKSITINAPENVAFKAQPFGCVDELSPEEAAEYMTGHPKINAYSAQYTSHLQSQHMKALP